MKKVTIQDIADELGVSRNTVSKAINNSDGLAEATRERILQKAIEMGYKHFSYIRVPPLLSAFYSNMRRGVSACREGRLHCGPWQQMLLSEPLFLFCFRFSTCGQIVKRLPGINLFRRDPPSNERIQDAFGRSPRFVRAF